MKSSKNTIYILFSSFLIAIVTLLIIGSATEQNKIKMRSSSSPKSEMQEREGRAEYFFNLMRDPVTNKIPDNIRHLELEFAKSLDRNSSSVNKSILQYTWQEAGPKDVGGRTRALAVDKTNPNVIIAGGVSGGIWKSTDKGVTWAMKSSPEDFLSVTSIAQDPRSGSTNIWYYTTGEYDGNSASAQGWSALFYGDGVFKSTDNGESWSALNNTVSDDPTAWDGEFDLCSRVVVSPRNGYVYIAANGIGILRSTNGGTNFTSILGSVNDHVYCDVVVNSNGDLAAVLSAVGWNSTQANTPGVYKSTNDGTNWEYITISQLSADCERSVLSFAPSNPNSLYMFANEGADFFGKDKIGFYKITYSTKAVVDRSANMPDFNQDFEDYIHTQGNYNMTLAIKPDDENLIVLGATSLFRSTNGFSSKPNNQKNDWIGGYNTESFFYPNLHPDIHSFAFDPTDPKKVWFGHDGGLSYAEDITTTSYATYFPWIDKNNGYNVTQFYMVTMPDEAGDDRILGGTQDNGSPFFRFNGTSPTNSEDITTGDGAYAYFGNEFAYGSAQLGAVLRIDYNSSGNPTRDAGWSNITPRNAANQLFINPYVVDPNDENYMYYPAGNSLWRNNQLNSLPYNSSFNDGITTGWTKLTSLGVPNNYTITALQVSISNPTHRLYYGASSASNNNPLVPKLYRLNNATTASSGAVELTLPGVADGAYIHNIAINPDDGNEIIVVLSNYNIVGLFHSTNGGDSFTTIEGNLTGDTQNPGPSIRSATIVPSNGSKQYFVATSIGLYSTTALNGANTSWIKEGANVIGNTVCNYLTSRKSDGKVLVGTHGRGAFTGNSQSGSGAIASVTSQQLNIQVNSGSSASTTFQLQNIGDQTLNYNITASGNFNQNPGRAFNRIQKRKSITTNLHDEYYLRHSSKSLKKINQDSPFSVAASKQNVNKNDEILGTDKLILDDGNESVDSFVGYGDGSAFSWLNEFDMTNFNFELDSFEFFMRSENSFLNMLYVAVYDAGLNVLADGTIFGTISSEGAWNTVYIDTPINFTTGDKFYLNIETQLSSIDYPAGTDEDAQILNKSFYLDDSSNLIPLNSVAGFENGAFVIRAIGTITGGGNVNPVAIAQVSKNQALIGENISFDASQSYDNDGTISSYVWNFGDGGTSSNVTINHSYATEGSFNYSLTVTDNDGATGIASGTVNVTSGVTRLTVQPSSGNVAASNEQIITVTLNATGLAPGNYTGQVSITSNGGNIIIPLTMVVNSINDVQDQQTIPTEFELSQNYPNPFNPTTTIRYAVPTVETGYIPSLQHITLKIYDILGNEVVTLVDEPKRAGYYEVNFNAAELTSGVYIYKLRAGDFVSSKKMLLLK
ncbi:MAG: PKD domain-containing protein [bacterium]